MNNTPLPYRRSIRLKNYDYAQAGAYFVTVCTHDRACLFGHIEQDTMHLNEYGQMVDATWQGLPKHYAEITLGTFVVMPNHIHGIVVLETVGAGFKPARHGLPEILRGFKTFSARQINASRQTSGAAVWQRNYYEHVIRSEQSLQEIEQYICANPAQWSQDQENPLRANDVRAGLKPAPT